MKCDLREVEQCIKIGVGTEDSCGSETIPYNTTMMDTRPYTYFKNHRCTLPNINMGFG